MYILMYNNIILSTSYDNWISIKLQTTLIIYLYTAHKCDLSDKSDEATQEEMVNKESDFDHLYDDKQFTMYEE